MKSCESSKCLDTVLVQQYGAYGVYRTAALGIYNSVHNKQRQNGVCTGSGVAGVSSRVLNY